MTRRVVTQSLTVTAAAHALQGHAECSIHLVGPANKYSVTVTVTVTAGAPGLTVTVTGYLF